MDRTWQPLLDGDEAAQVLGVVEEVATVVSRAPESGGDSASGGDLEVRPPLWRVSLNEGLPGFSLLEAYLYFHTRTALHAERALDYLDRATDSASGLRLSDSLYFGFPGIAWATSHLAGRIFEEEEDGCVEVDELLERSLARFPWPGNHELLTGLVGLGIYAVERWPRPAAIRCLERIVALLDERAERHAEGAGFLSPPETIRPGQRDRFPAGTFNLGMAHGQAGVIALLGSACRLGVAAERARPLLGAAVSWLLARELPSSSPFRFSRRHTPGGELERGQIAWCHGDLGIASALLLAADAASEAAWEAEARRIARAAAAYTLDDAYVADGALCHGAGGAGHLFNRLYQATGEAELGAAARFWLRRALSFRASEGGVAGFKAVTTSGWLDLYGFREGASGIALALLAAVSPTEPAWDRLLLASLPPA